MNQTTLIPSAELKYRLAEKLNTLGGALTENEALQIGLALGVSFRTVQRYCSGKVEEVRRIELAEKILAELEKQD